MGNYGYDWVQVAAGLSNHISQAFVVSVGEISLKRSGLNGVDGQNREQHRMAAERLFVHSDDGAARLLHCCKGVCGRTLHSFEPGFSWRESLGAGLGFSGTASRGSTFDHSNTF